MTGDLHIHPSLTTLYLNGPVSLPSHVEERNLGHCLEPAQSEGLTRPKIRPVGSCRGSCALSRRATHDRSRIGEAHWLEQQRKDEHH